MMVKIEGRSISFAKDKGLLFMDNPVREAEYVDKQPRRLGILVIQANPESDSFCGEAVVV